jgi:serine/threonine-protein kinase
MSGTRDSGDDETRLQPEARRPSKPPSTGDSTSGWSSGSIEHGRFEPGTVLGARYRIVGRLGRGGMGEVYRADDLKLGQPVALKFLPADVDRDPARLTQLHGEVRMARQVSHPNVCRVYDIDEEDGHTFLSMEYVDGEDLASLLRRIGRFPEERGLAIARQVCAGLAAAHERGVVHRDFKPANVMIDGSGAARIADFGLAGVTGESLRAGTPAYMAPEQLAGAEVTSRSDIYALGLVLYEIFTGQRAIEGGNLAELIHKREQSGITPPSVHVRDIAPEIEQTILRCLRPDPEQRPATALAVAAALPGGDPLAAALAAGETPSPDIVAAAGGTSVISARTAALAGLWLALSILALLVLYDRVMLVNRVPMPKAPAALEDRAVETLSKLGYTQQATASAWGLGFSQDYSRFLAETSTDANRWDRLRQTRPESLILWYRTSPRPLVPFGSMNPVAGTNPPLSVSGMTLVVLDASGRLSEFIAVPPPIESSQGPPPATDWPVLFEAAGLAISSFTPSTPTVVPPVHAHERAAWEGRLAEVPDHTIRVEAASFAGKPVYFVIRGPWSRSARALPPPTALFGTVTAALEALVVPALMLAGAVLARRNVKLGRGDRRGAFRVAAAVFLLLMVAWMLRRHVMPPAADLDRFFTAVGGALLNAAVLWLTYLGLEPYVRRHSPDSLIAWTRLVSGNWKDPRVGADVMVGVSAGLAMTLFYAVHNVIPPLMGRPMPQPLAMDASLLVGTREALAYFCGRIASGIQGAMLCVVGYVALRLLLTRFGTWPAAAAAVMLFTPVAVNGMFPPGTPILDLVLGAALIVVLVAVIVRWGLLAATAALTTHFILLRSPLTTDFSSWRAATAFWFLAAVAVAGFGSIHIARNGVVRGD